MISSRSCAARPATAAAALIVLFVASALGKRTDLPGRAEASAALQMQQGAGVGDLWINRASCLRKLKEVQAFDDPNRDLAKLAALEYSLKDMAASWLCQRGIQQSCRNFIGFKGWGGSSGGTRKKLVWFQKLNKALAIVESKCINRGMCADNLKLVREAAEGHESGLDRLGDALEAPSIEYDCLKRVGIVCESVNQVGTAGKSSLMKTSWLNQIEQGLKEVVDVCVDQKACIAKLPEVKERVQDDEKFVHIERALLGTGVEQECMDPVGEACKVILKFGTQHSSLQLMNYNITLEAVLSSVEDDCVEV